jgi:hypothetical protein
MRSAKERLVILAASTALATLLLAGCGSTPIPPPTPAPTTSAPVIASEDEALAAATEAYAAYLGVIDVVLADGGSDPSVLADVASGDALGAEEETANMYAERGYKSVGTTSFDSLSIQSLDNSNAKRTVSMIVYVCVDVTDVDVLNSDGVSVVPPGRVSRYPLLVALTTTSDAQPNRLLISSSETWTGTNFC